MMSGVVSEPFILVANSYRLFPGRTSTQYLGPWPVGSEGVVSIQFSMSVFCFFVTAAQELCIMLFDRSSGVACHCDSSVPFVRAGTPRACDQ
jgi:hypothetical protein